MTLEEQFVKAQADVQNLLSRPSNDKLLKLYAFFKQSTEGDVSGDRPGGFDFKGMAKYDAWAELKGKTSDDAKQGYIDLVMSLQA
jgi:acyl-CoA-binding protein